MLRRAVVPTRIGAFRAAAALALALALWTWAGSAGAQAGVWSTSGPLGGNVYCLVNDPSRPSTLYAGTSQGVFRSDDAGSSWRISGVGIPAARVQTIAIDPTTTSTLYAGTLTPSGVQSVGIFKSTDGGATWAAINEGLSDPFIGVTPLDVAALAIDPSHPGTIVAGTIDSEIFRSTDGGLSWQPETFGGFNVSLQVLGLQFDPSNSATVYTASSEGLLKSGDNGVSWVVYGTTVPLFALAIDPSSPQTLYAGNAAGLGMLKSTDGGAHWLFANTGLPVLQDAAGKYSPLVVALSVDPGNTSTVYAGTYGSGLFESANRAGSWAASSSGIRNTYVSALALAPENGQSSTLYAGTLGGGVFQSSDGAQSWTAANAGLDASIVGALVLDPAAPDTLYAGTSDGVAKSGDGGQSWQAINAGFPVSAVSALVLAPGSPGTLFAGTLGGGLLKSSDGGANWSASTQGLAELYISSIAIDPTAPATLYAGTAHPYDGSHSERVFKSTNGGGAWTQTSLDASGFSVGYIAVNPAGAAQVIAGSHGAVGYFQSLDAGKNWSTIASDSSCGGINGFLFDPSGTTFYIAGTSGVCRSSDGGKTWQVSAVGGSLSVEALLLDPSSPSTLYAGTSMNGVGGGGVFRSRDGGQTWEALGSGLAPIAVTALSIDPLEKTLHASTHGAGVADLLIATDRSTIHAPAPTRRRTGVVPPR
jgi:photosystem II stability/assembly factor-like uncharacterized protein